MHAFLGTARYIRIVSTCTSKDHFTVVVAFSRSSHKPYFCGQPKLIPGAEKCFTDYMQRMFHDWEDAGAAIADIWTDVMGYCSSLVSWVGEVPGKPGIYINAGFTGPCMPRILGCSEALAALVRGEAEALK